MRKQTQAGEGVLTKLRFRDDELKTWQISESYKNYCFIQDTVVFMDHRGA